MLLYSGMKVMYGVTLWFHCRCWSRFSRTTRHKQKHRLMYYRQQAMCFNTSKLKARICTWYWKQLAVSEPRNTLSNHLELKFKIKKIYIARHPKLNVVLTQFLDWLYSSSFQNITCNFRRWMNISLQLSYPRIKLFDPNMLLSIL